MFSLKDICFTYSINGMRAVDRVSLDIAPGRIYALLGENGAGKTTLAKICTGNACADSGSMFFNKKKLVLHSAADGITAGIVLVPQHPQLAPELTIWKNLSIGLHTDSKLSGIHIRRKKTASYIEERLAQYGIHLPLFTQAKYLDTAQLQWAVIGEALLKNPSVLFLDEPTSSYSPVEINRFYRILRHCVKGGMCIIVITHRIQEVLSFVDTAHILREGKLVQTSVITEKTTAEDLLSCIFGTSTGSSFSAQQSIAEEKQKNTEKKTFTEGLKLCGISAGTGLTGQPLRNITFNAPRGKITGVAGIKNQGIELLEDVLVGIQKPSAGTLQFEKQLLSRIERTKIAYIPSRRLERGVAYRLSIFENSAVRFRHSLYNCGIYAKKQIDGWKKQTKLDLKRDWNTPVFTLSGGMVQKLIFVRELDNPTPMLVICAEPYWGLDRKTQHILLKKLRSLAQQGATVLVLSSDADAALEICDYIHVLYKGTVQLCMQRQEYNRTVLIEAMMQAKQHV